MNKKELFNAVNEMIDVFGGLKDDDGEEIVINNKTSEEELQKIATDAIALIAEGDEFTEETQAVIDEIKEGQKKPEKKETVKNPKVKNENQALIDEINEIDTLNALKGIVKTEDVFSSLRKSIATEKNVDILKEKMLKLLEPGAEEIVVEKEKEEVAKPVKKQEKAPVKKVEKDVVVNKEKKEKVNKINIPTALGQALKKNPKTFEQWLTFTKEICVKNNNQSDLKVIRSGIVWCMPLLEMFDIKFPAK